MCTVLLPPGVNRIAVNKMRVYQYIFDTKPQGREWKKKNCRCGLCCVDGLISHSIYLLFTYICKKWYPTVESLPCVVFVTLLESLAVTPIYCWCKSVKKRSYLTRESHGSFSLYVHFLKCLP